VVVCGSSTNNFYHLRICVENSECITCDIFTEFHAYHHSIPKQPCCIYNKQKSYRFNTTHTLLDLHFYVYILRGARANNYQWSHKSKAETVWVLDLDQLGRTLLGQFGGSSLDQRPRFGRDGQRCIAHGPTPTESKTATDELPPPTVVQKAASLLLITSMISSDFVGLFGPEKQKVVATPHMHACQFCKLFLLACGMFFLRS